MEQLPAALAPVVSVVTKERDRRVDPVVVGIAKRIIESVLPAGSKVEDIKITYLKLDGVVLVDEPSR
jgi:hypothetical protein